MIFTTACWSVKRQYRVPIHTPAQPALNRARELSNHCICIYLCNHSFHSVYEQKYKITGAATPHCYTNIFWNKSPVNETEQMVSSWELNIF